MVPDPSRLGNVPIMERGERDRGKERLDRVRSLCMARDGGGRADGDGDGGRNEGKRETNSAERLLSWSAS